MSLTKDNIIKTLKSLGLSDKESQIYLVIRELKMSSMEEIEKATTTKRKALYKLLDSLVKKGVINESTVNRKKVYRPEGSDRLYMLLEQNDWQLRHIKDTLGGLVKSIDQIAPSRKQDGKPEIRYFEDFDGVQLVYNEILQHKEVFAYVNVSEIYKFFPENIKKFTQAVAERKMVLKEIVENSRESKNYVKLANSKLHEVRFLPKGQNLDIDYLIYGDYLTIIDYKAKPPVSVLIKHKDIADSARTIFESIWNNLPQVK